MGECFFCKSNGGDILFNCDLYRIILVDDKDYPGYLRIVLNRHVKELTDLDDSDNLALYAALIKSERILRTVFKPDKINVASFGNLTPHVHWHIIPRYVADKHFPNPPWGSVTNLAYTPDTILFDLNIQLKNTFNQLFTA